jgi:TIR domain
MSIDSLPPTGQGPASDATGSTPTPGGNSTDPKALQDRTRRIFICYPRSTLEEVAEFHKILKQRLDVRGRSYDVFRDLGDNRQERINPGDYWREILQAKLDSSICCIVILVPGIFESEECAKEIEYFQSRIKQDKRRFFFPVEFLEVKSRIEPLARKKNTIALAMKDIHHYDFVGGAFEPNRKIYEKKVDDIANAIHQRVDELDGEIPPMPPLGGAIEVSPSPPRPPVPFAWRYVAAAAVTVLAGGLAWYFLGGKTPDAGSVRSEQQLPISPTWTDLEPNTDLVKAVRVRKEPTRQAEYIRQLAPDGLIPSLKYGPHKTGSIDNELWYRIAQADFPVFFPERDNVGAVVRWQPVDGCLQANKSLRARSAVVDGRDLDEFVHGEPLRGAVQSAQVIDQKWVRYPRHDDGYGYLRWGDIEACPRR